MQEYQKSLNYVSYSAETLRRGLSNYENLNEEQRIFLHQFREEHLKHNVNFGIGLFNSKVFEINNDVIRLLTLTENKYDENYHKLPFDVIFIESKVPIIGRFGDDYRTNIYYHGFLVFNVYDYNESGVLFPWYDKNKKEVQNTRIMGYYTKPNENDGGLMCCSLTEEKNAIENLVQFPLPTYELKQIRSFILNFLDFLNDPDIEFVQTRHNIRNNKKRIKKGKTPLPNSTTIKVKNKLKRYIYDLKTNKKKFYSYKFWVRGHWRTFRSEKYGENQGKRIWIKPYIKGEGLLIDKKYELKIP